MKILLILLAIATAVYATSLRDWIAGQSDKTTAALCTKLATVTATTNNVQVAIFTNGDHAAYNAWQDGCGASWRYDWNTGNPDVGIVTLNSQYIDVPNPPTNGVMSGLLQDRSAMIHQRAIGQCPQDFTIITNTVTTTVPTSWTWRDIGLDHLPNGGEVEAAQKP